MKTTQAPKWKKIHENECGDFIRVELKLHRDLICLKMFCLKIGFIQTAGEKGRGY